MTKPPMQATVDSLFASQSGESQVESCEECLREAAECDRLGALAQTPGTRILMLVASRQWRQLAQKATERCQSACPSGAFVLEG